MIVNFIEQGTDKEIEMELSDIPNVGDFVNIGNKLQNLRMFGRVAEIEWQLGDYDGFKIRAVHVIVEAGVVKRPDAGE